MDLKNLIIEGKRDQRKSLKISKQVLEAAEVLQEKHICSFTDLVSALILKAYEQTK